MDKDLTPSKAIWRVILSPNSKKHFMYFVQKLFRTQIIFTGSNKSQVGVDLEILVGVKLENRESCLTDMICRNCSRNNDDVDKKVLEFWKQFFVVARTYIPY